MWVALVGARDFFEGGFALAGFGGEEAVEGEALGGEAAGDEGADGGVGSGDGEDGDAGGDGGCGDLGAGVGDAWSACVADYGDSGALFEVFDEFFGTGAFVVHVVADGGGADFEVIEELLGLAGVFAGDAVGAGAGRGVRGG